MQQDLTLGKTETTGSVLSKQMNDFNAQVTDQHFGCYAYTQLRLT